MSLSTIGTVVGIWDKGPLLLEVSSIQLIEGLHCGMCLSSDILLCSQTRHKVLVSAFLRPLKDPFPPARCAAIGAITATHSYYTTSDIASRLLPALCSLTVDKEKSVRDEVYIMYQWLLSV